MKLLSLNCRGLGSDLKKNWIRRVITKEKPDLVGFQETKLAMWDNFQNSRVWDGDDGGYAFLSAQGNSGGLVTIWDTKLFNCTQIIQEVDFLVVIGSWLNKDGLVGFINVYAPNSVSLRKGTWDRLQIVIAKDDIDWCIFGDFNEVRDPIERLNSEANLRGMRDFNNFISSSGLIEAPLIGRKFTRISDDGLKFSKLDRFLMTVDFSNRGRNLRAKALDRGESDHVPILLEEDKADFGPTPFKFFDSWLVEDDLRSVVEQNWKCEKISQFPDRVFRDKLKGVKAAIKEWSKRKFGNLDSQIEEAKSESNKLEKKAESEGWSDTDKDRWLSQRKQFMELDQRRSEMRKQKAKLKWLSEGDENSKFFHAAIKKRERRNDRPKLRSEKLKKLSLEEAETLERPLEEVEVWNAIKSSGKNKAPGPDGFSFNFLKKFWDIIKVDLMAALHWFWDSERISLGCNSSFITLIPKILSPEGLGDYRPISLIGVYYKLVAVILAERLKKVVDYIRHKKRIGLVFKVDFEKAYDSVEWNFLLDCLGNMGFGQKWRRWIEACLRSSTLSVLVNGSPTKEFEMGRGLRQGDPLAPFLFLIVAENLNVLMEEACEKGVFEGLRIGNEGVMISHLQYADDVIFFGKWSKVNLKNLIKILECFRLLSGLKINLRKSKLFGMGINEQEVRDWAREMGCEGGILPFVYLGLPVGASMSNIKNWAPVVEKVKKKLGSWKAKWISFGGRLTLVKSVLGSLSLYFLSLFRAPRGVIGELEKIRNRFFWGGGELGKSSLVWVKWDKVVSSFEKGGLDIGDLSSMNHALLGKWWWWFLSGENCLWTSVIKSIYGLSGGLDGRVERGRGVGGSVWSNIIRVGGIPFGDIPSFADSFRIKVGGGDNTRFWDEKWLSDTVLAEKFPRLLRLESKVDAKVSERGRWIDNRWEWSWSWRREPRGREIGELGSLVHLLGNWEPERDKLDYWEWKLDVEKGYSVKVCRDRFAECRGVSTPSGVKTLWSKLLPKKVNVHMWRARLGRLPSREALDEKGIDVDSLLCPRCGEVVESLDHALVNCREVKNFWTRIGKWWNKNLAGIGSLSQLIEEDADMLESHKGRYLWISVKWAVLYLIWQDRNNIVFKNTTSNLGSYFFIWQRQIFEWMSSRSPRIGDWFKWLEVHHGDSVG
ncbi:hypothetical protein OSB04_004830 [Centaurea solstitialis]|uniref:Reverse transcriptase domain-containing protein n=1 Tax=Centaurea solstitialis TaxID=347529 RepID=A0AA38WP55_9ASTR|nr:hypothetical protein OSB04_004830 [Centaurea solstitialis]